MYDGNVNDYLVHWSWRGVDCEYFWICNKPECDLIIEAIEQSIENGSTLSSLQKNFYDFIINAQNNKGFSLSLIEREEELTEQFMDGYEEEQYEEEYSSEEYSSEDSEDSESLEQEEATTAETSEN